MFSWCSTLVKVPWKFCQLGSLLLKCPKGLTFPTQIRSFRHLWILPQHHLGWKMSKKRLSALVIFVLLFWDCEIITFIAKRGPRVLWLNMLSIHANILEFVSFHTLFQNAWTPSLLLNLTPLVGASKWWERFAEARM